MAGIATCFKPKHTSIMQGSLKLNSYVALSLRISGSQLSLYVAMQLMYHVSVAIILCMQYGVWSHRRLCVYVYESV